MKVRCLFCKCGSEKNVVRIIEDQRLGHPLFGERVKLLRVGRNQEIETIRPLLPGYVFVYTLPDDPDAPNLGGVDGVFRVLTYGKSGRETLAGRDLEFAEWLWRVGGRVEVLKAIQLGDRVEIVDELFKGLHGTVVRMDKRKKSVKIQLESGTALQYVTLSYRLLEKANADRPPRPEGENGNLSAGGMMDERRRSGKDAGPTKEAN